MDLSFYTDLIVQFVSLGYILVVKHDVGGLSAVEPWRYEGDEEDLEVTLCGFDEGTQQISTHAVARVEVTGLDFSLNHLASTNDSTCIEVQIDAHG